MFQCGLCGDVETGEVDALIVQNPYAMGYLGVETANLMNGQTGGPSVVDTATTIVTRERICMNRRARRYCFLLKRKVIDPVQKSYDNDKQSVKICTKHEQNMYRIV